MATQKQLEDLIDELELVLERSHITEETYYMLQNVKDKIFDIAYNDGDNLGSMTPLINLEKY